MAETTLLLTFDVEEFVIPEEAGIPFDEGQAFELGRQGLLRAMDVLACHGVPATHFVTLEFARRFPETLLTLVEAGHELALHAVEHRHDYRAMPAHEARALLSAGRAELQELTGAEIAGYRANRFRAPGPDVLRGIGVSWTSNLHPTWVPGEYDNRREPRTIHVREGLLEVPISVTPKLRLPGSWFWMRNFGATYLHYVALHASRDTGFLNLYVHPWEYADLPVVPGLSPLGKLSVRRTGERFASLLDRFLTWTKRRGFATSTITPYLRSGGWL